MPIGWWGALDQIRIAAILIGSGAIVYGFAILLVRGIRRAWTTSDQQHRAEGRSTSEHS